jgi:hypothetical protein
MRLQCKIGWSDGPEVGEKFGDARVEVVCFLQEFVELGDGEDGFGYGLGVVSEETVVETGCDVHFFEVRASFCGSARLKLVGSRQKSGREVGGDGQALRRVSEI